MWFTLALISAISAAVRRTGDKRLLTEYKHFTVGWAVQAFSLPFILLAALLGGHMLNPLRLGANFWLPLLGMCAVYFPLNTFLYLQAIKHGELSKVLPIQSLGPLISVVIGWIALGQRPSLLASIGIAIIVLGVYVLHLRGRSLHNPLRPFLEERHSLYMFLSVCCIGLTAIPDTIAVRASNPVYYSLANTAGAVIALYVAARIMKEPPLRLRKARMRMLGTTGALQGVTSTTYLMALATGPAAYVAAVRSTNVLMGSLIGVSRFGEPLTRPKIAALCLILLGSALLALGR